jgi:hypothetical protein
MVNIWDFSDYKNEREAAVSLANKFLERGLFRHCLGEHCFKDEKLFYEYKFEGDESSMNSSFRNLNNDSFILKISKRRNISNTSLDDLMDEFKENVKVKNRKYRLKTYKNVFLGNDVF